jgi:predicted nucleic acid-binding protein
MDMPIAAHVLNLGVTLVSNHLREFSRIGNVSKRLGGIELI